MISQIKVGLFGIGLDAYWPQFEGLYTRLEGYLDIIQRRLAQHTPGIVNLGLVDDAHKAFEAGDKFRHWT